MSGDTLNPRQRTLRTLALKQLEAVPGTLQRLLNATSEQADREAVEDAAGDVNAAAGILANWFGCEPPGR